MTTGAILEVLAALVLIGVGVWQYRRRAGEPNGGYGSQSAVILLVIAAIGGVVMNLAYHLAGKLIPSWLLHVHIGLGAIGTLLICWAAWFA